MTVATVLTVYGIETSCISCYLKQCIYIVATAPTVYGIETNPMRAGYPLFRMLQQHLSFTECAEGCEAAEEQSDDEVRTSEVPERVEVKRR